MILGNLLRGRPNDERGFVHRRLLGGVAKLAGIGAQIGIPGARAVSTITRGLAGGRGFVPGTGPRGSVPRTQLTRGVTQLSELEKRRGAGAKGFVSDRDQISRGLPRGFGGGGGDRNGCPPGMRPDFKSGQCEAAAGQEVGEAVMGRYGAGLIPGEIIIERAVCLKGMQLGDDGLCYNKSQISNKQRMWPAGRKPLLSGGDMRAISIAARAGRRLEGATKRLQRLGMMKKPAPRRIGPGRHQHARLLPAVSVPE